MPKRALRSGILAQRRELSLQQVSDQSHALQQRFLELPEYRNAQVVALYSPIHHEVETSVVAHHALAAGKTVLFPTVVGENLEFRRAVRLDQLTIGCFGILEPAAGIAVDPGLADLIVVPGVAFDTSGRRIGYGKGYYDRALHRMEGSGKLAGFCYDFQLFEEIVGEPHDVVMDLVVTESRVVRVYKNIG